MNVRIGTVAPGSPAAAAGLVGSDAGYVPGKGVEYSESGDVIVAIDGRPVKSADDLVRIVSERLEPGQQSTFEVFRDGKRKAITVKLGERPRGPTDNACS